MNEVGAMQILDGFGNLINDVLLVLILEDVLADNAVQVDLHVLKHEIDVFVVFGADHPVELNYVFVVELLKEHDLAVSALCVG